MSIPTLRPVYTFTGTIETPKPLIRSCGLEALQCGYGAAAVDALIPSSSPPSFECKESEYAWENLRQLHRYYANVDGSLIEGFWKKRLIIALLVSPNFFSATFVPRPLIPLENRILYVQKGGDKEVGFYAPYVLRDLTVTQQNQAILPLRDEESIPETIQDISEVVRLNLQACLEFFMRDDTSLRLGLIFRDQDRLICRCWLKV